VHQGARSSDTGFSDLVNSTGGFSQTVPLDLPSARAGLPVPVSVVYGGRRMGAAGLGWDVPLSYVRRDNSLKHRIPFFDSSHAAVPRQTVTLVLQGRAIPMVRKGDLSSTTWVARHD
jgi:hypothetical protein